MTDLRGVVAIQEQGTVVAARSGMLAIIKEGVELRRVKVGRIAEVQLFGDVALSGGARSLLLREGIEILFLSQRGTYLGRISGWESRAGERRLAQVRRLSDRAFAQALAQRVIAAKIHNQRSLLMRLCRENEDEEMRASVAALRALLHQVETTTEIAELMGVEGRASVLYYRGLARGLRHPQIRFERRTRRPPRDPANACLSFGYTLLCTKVEGAIRKAGLDVYIGALHQAGRGKPALALDVMEPLRILVDRMVWKCLNRGQWAVEDFDFTERWDEELTGPEAVTGGGIEVRPDDQVLSLGPAVYLGSTGRAVFIREWAGLWRKRFEYPAYDLKLELSHILDAEVQALSRDLEAGELTWEPFRFK
jgi:CRISPR-associated protein Cas1